MIKVLFFARVREQLGQGAVELPFSDATRTLADLKRLLIIRNGDSWQPVLSADNLVQAVNQEVASGDTQLADGDEVAFFPPVTGG